MKYRTLLKRVIINSFTVKYFKIVSMSLSFFQVVYQKSTLKVANVGINYNDFQEVIL